MSLRVWICIPIYAAVMAGVSYAAHKVVGNFGMIGAAVTLGAIYGVAVLIERRKPRQEVWPPI